MPISAYWKYNAMSPRPPQPKDVPMDGDEKAFKGANPWSGPYLVLAVIAVAGLVVVGLIVAVLVQVP